MTDLKRMKISDLVRDPRFQLRQGLNEEHVQKLTVAIKKGKVPPIIVTPQNLLVDGWHRVAAHERLGRKTIAAEVREFRSDADIRAAGVRENMSHGLNLAWPDEQKAAAKALLDAGMKQVDVARAFGARLSRHGKSSKAPVWIRNLVSIPRNQELWKERRKRAMRREQSLTEDEHRKVIRDEFGLGAYSQKYSPVVRWGVSGDPKAPGTPILFVSDWHFGETVLAEEVHGCNEFNHVIAAERLRITFETSVSLLKSHLAHADYPGIVLCLGGDMISGGIHDELRETDFPKTKGEQARQAAEHLSDAVAFLREEFPRVIVYGVPGNHGRNSRKPRMKLYAEDNFDYHTYLLVERDFRGKDRVEFNFPKAREVSFEVPGRRFLLVHGDQFRGGDGEIGPAGPIIRGGRRKQFTISNMPGMTGHQTMLCGHHHQFWVGSRVIVNGSIKGYDEFALGINAPYEPPIQTLLTVHPKHGINWIMPIYCET